MSRLLSLAVAALFLLAIDSASSQSGELDGTTPKNDRHVLGVEVEFMDLTGGQKLRIAGRHGSLMGNTLTIAGTECEILIPKGKKFAALQRFDVREMLLLLDVRYQGPQEGKFVFELDNARIAADGEGAFATCLDHIETLPPERRLAIVSYLRSEPSLQDSPALSQRIRDEALSVLGMQAAAQTSWSPQQWLETGNSLLGENPRWRQLVVKVANTSSNETFASLILQNGYLKAHSGWAVKETFLEENGLVEIGGDKIISQQQGVLENAIQSWKGRELGSKLLRNLTRQLFERHASDHQVKKGMNRLEILMAWGYPKEVIWISKGRGLYEGWFYDKDRFIALAEGLVFTFED